MSCLVEHDLCAVASWRNGGPKNPPQRPATERWVGGGSFFWRMFSFLVCRKGRLAVPIYMHAHRPLILCIRFYRDRVRLPAGDDDIARPVALQVALRTPSARLIVSWTIRFAICIYRSSSSSSSSFCTKKGLRDSAAIVLATGPPPSVHNFDFTLMSFFSLLKRQLCADWNSILAIFSNRRLECLTVRGLL
jgi:hypothetical protein